MKWSVGSSLDTESRLPVPSVITSTKLLKPLHPNGYKEFNYLFDVLGLFSRNAAALERSFRGNSYRHKISHHSATSTVLLFMNSRPFGNYMKISKKNGL